MYLAITSSVTFPELQQKYPRAHRCRPQNCFFKCGYSANRWCAVFPFNHCSRRLESTEIRGREAHAAKLVPSARDRSSRSRMNFTRIEVLTAVARNSGRVLRRAMATTCSEGASPGRTVRIQEPKDRQTILGCVAERI